MKRLILFDIDETMISSDGAGRRALARTLLQVFNITESSMAQVTMSGKTDPQIIREILLLNDVPAQTIEKETPALIKSYLSVLHEEICKSDYYIVHAGVYDLLLHLQEMDEAYLGLLTGNVEEGARIKLQPADLNHHFPMGAYGSDSANRLELPAVARTRAHEHFGQFFEKEEVVIIGDSIYDVHCAKAFGARSLAVNSGRTTRAALESTDPDYLFPTLSDTTSVLEAIFAPIKIKASS